MPKLPGRESTSVTYPLTELLVDYWLGPHDAGQTYRCVGCGLPSAQWTEVANNWGAVACLNSQGVDRVGELCPTCTEKLLELHR